MAKTKKESCTTCNKFRAKPGSKKNEKVDNLCCLTRRVIEDPENYKCEAHGN